MLVNPVLPDNSRPTQYTDLLPAWDSLKGEASIKMGIVSAADATQQVRHVIEEGTRQVKGLRLGARRQIIRDFVAQLTPSEEQLSTWSAFYGVSTHLLTMFLDEAKEIALNIADADCGVSEESSGGATLVLFPPNDPRNVAYFIPCIILAGSGLIGKASSREPSIVSWAAECAIEAGYPKDALTVISHMDGDILDFVNHAHRECHTTVYMGGLENGKRLFGDDARTVFYCAANTNALICSKDFVEEAINDLLPMFYWPRDCVSVKNIFMPATAIASATELLRDSIGSLGGNVSPRFDDSPLYACGEPDDFKEFINAVVTFECSGAGKVVASNGEFGKHESTPIVVQYRYDEGNYHPLMVNGPSQRYVGLCPVEAEGPDLIEWVRGFYRDNTVDRPMASAVYCTDEEARGTSDLAYEVHIRHNPIKMGYKSVWHQGIDLPGEISNNAGVS
jgi:hypothetical protein